MLDKLKKMAKKGNRMYESKCAALSALLITSPALSSVFASSVTDITKTDSMEVKWPWEKFLTALTQQVTGPLARILGILGIVVGILGCVYGDHGGGMRKVFGIILGMSTIFFAASFVNLIMSSASGATILP